MSRTVEDPVVVTLGVGAGEEPQAGAAGAAEGEERPLECSSGYCARAHTHCGNATPLHPPSPHGTAIVHRIGAGVRELCVRV